MGTQVKERSTSGRRHRRPLTGVEMGATPAPHPATYSKELIPVIAGHLAGRSGTLLDLMAGSGKAAQIADAVGMEYLGVELEPEWAAHNPKTLVGDATDLWWIRDETIQAICVSPAYANRMAERYAGSPRDLQRAAEGKRILRNTYRISLGRLLSDNSGAALQWGRQYRALHEGAWAEAARVLEPGGLFVLNIKNHIRSHQVVDVAAWHFEVLERLGLVKRSVEEVETRHYGAGANADKRCPELVAVFEKPE